MRRKMVCEEECFGGDREGEPRKISNIARSERPKNGSRQHERKRAKSRTII
jgi:hypothetical protein